MNTNAHAGTQIYRIHSCKKRKRRTTSAETKVCHGQITLTGYSQTSILEF